MFIINEKDILYSKRQHIFFFPNLYSLNNGRAVQVTSIPFKTIIPKILATVWPIQALSWSQ